MNAGVAAICFIVSEGQILLMQARWAGMQWSVIGGRVEPGETPAAAVRREVQEETGLTLTDCRAAGHILQEEGEGRTTSIHLFTATGFTGELRGSEEGEPVWWPLAEVGRLPLLGVVRVLLPPLVSLGASVEGIVRVAEDGEVVSWTLGVLSD